MTKKFLILSILTIIFGLGVVFVSQKQEPAIKETSTVEVDPDKKVCTGFAKWTKDGEFKTIRSECITEKEYQDSLEKDKLKNPHLALISDHLWWLALSIKIGFFLFIVSFLLLLFQ